MSKASLYLRCFAALMSALASGISLPVSDISFRYALVTGWFAVSSFSALSRKACRYVYAAATGLAHDLLRSVASFVICLQAIAVRWTAALRPLVRKAAFLTAFGLGWYVGNSILLLDPVPDPGIGGITIETVVERIIGVESDGNPNKKSKRSSATGLGQFLDQTWLELIRLHRPDLARGRSDGETLELRRDAELAREITRRFAERNAEMLRKKGLPVTPGTLYLAHFAGGAGAIAILSAPEQADAASAMAGADPSGRTKREKIVKANPFLERFTVADLRHWAERKMRVSGS
jgi:hypothetical protein